MDGYLYSVVALKYLRNGRGGEGETHAQEIKQFDAEEGRRRRDLEGPVEIELLLQLLDGVSALGLHYPADFVRDEVRRLEMTEHSLIRRGSTKDPYQSLFGTMNMAEWPLWQTSFSFRETEARVCDPLKRS